MNFIDLFSGIGGFRFALSHTDARCLAHAEINKKVASVYDKMFHRRVENLGDINKLTELDRTDLITAGVPCQSWSSAGKNGKFSDPRGALWFKTLELINTSRPKSVILENVKGLAEPRNKAELNLILELLDDYGYDSWYDVLDARDYGVPQRRERIFIVAIRKDLDVNFQFYKPKRKYVKLLNYLKIDGHLSKGIRKGEDELFITYSDIREGDLTVHSWDLLELKPIHKEICLSILRNRRKKKYGTKDGNPLSFDDIFSLTGCFLDEVMTLVDLEILKKTPDGKYDIKNSKANQGINDVNRVFHPCCTSFPTITGVSSRDYISEVCFVPSKAEGAYIFKHGLYRKLTIKEMLMLQGFPKPEYNNDIITERMVGNAVCVPVARSVVKDLERTGIFE